MKHGKSLNKKEARIYRCSFSDISHIFKKYHYKSDSIGGGISQCFALIVNDVLQGGSVLGLPRHQDKYKNCIDIRRMALLDECPKNAESFFIGQIIRWIASNTDYEYVLSYSDKTVNHSGIIYKASNFEYIGETAKSRYIIWKNKRYHMRSLSVDRHYSRKLKEAISTGEAKIIEGKSKSIWLYKISKKLKRKRFFAPVYDGNPNQIYLL